MVKWKLCCASSPVTCDARVIHQGARGVDTRSSSGASSEWSFSGLPGETSSQTASSCEALQALQRHQPVTFMDGVEAAAEEADAHAGGVGRDIGDEVIGE